ncbi:hypothetical protein HHI36_009816 [Cryptolaemus montrouzieri]|uniref:DUF4817 domain-containing protein n=1 Tax=Cryptolaemus montrouzieri TaxID=559131 RepID=A0ABD2MGW3_9CUCU
MHLIYGECGCNASAAARLYRERYPNAERLPDYRVFVHVHESYSVGRLPHVRKSGGTPQADYEDMVLDKVENDTGTSVRAIEMNTGVPKSIAQRILKRHQYHPYHVQCVQILVPQDYLPRMEFRRRMLAKNQEDPQFLDKILWTCKKDGYFNLHNLHGCYTENPHLKRQGRSQNQFKINLWTGILNGQAVGSFELPENLNGENYLNFLQNELPILLEDVPLNIRRDMWYEQDGCPARYARPVRDHLDNEYRG